MAKHIQTNWGKFNNAPEFYLRTYNSPRRNGKLVHRSNPMICCRVTKKTETEFPISDNTGIGYYYNNLPRVINELSDAYGQAFRRFKQKAWNGSQVQTLVSLAEARKSLDMVADLTGRVLTGVRLIRRGHFADAARHFQLANVPQGASKSRQFLDNWMAYRYGWIPTLSDIYNHAEAIQKPPKEAYVVARGTGSWSRRSLEGKPWEVSSGTARVTLKAKVVVSNPVLARLNQFGVLNPLEVAWELVPLSFVVDWFAGVGDYLSNISAFVGLTLVDGSQTYAIKCKCWDPKDKSFGYYLVGKQRIVSNVLPNPPIMWGSGLNPKRAMDLLALLQHAIRGR